MLCVFLYMCLFLDWYLQWIQDKGWLYCCGTGWSYSITIITCTIVVMMHYVHAYVNLQDPLLLCLLLLLYMLFLLFMLFGLLGRLKGKNLYFVIFKYIYMNKNNLNTCTVNKTAIINQIKVYNRAVFHNDDSDNIVKPFVTKMV